MSGFTPGPWRVEPNDFNGPEGDGVSVKCCGDDWFIAHVWNDFEAAPDDPPVRGIPPHGTALANARLIAAAPDLLAACKMIADYAVSWQPLTPGDISEVNAAIAKAEGGDHFNEVRR